MKRNFCLVKNNSGKKEGKGQEELLSDQEIEQDNTFENNLMLLLSELEQLRVRLDEKAQKQPLLSIQILSEMINRLAEFSEKVINIDPRGGFLARVMNRLTDKHPQIQLLHVERNRLSVETALNLYKGWAGDKKERQQVFERIGLGMVEVMEAYLVFFGSSFKSMDRRKEWQGTYSVFIHELSKTVETSRF